MVTLPPPQVDSAILAERGWKKVEVPTEDGDTRYMMVPLTPAEFLHPQEDYHMPISAFHNQTNTALFDMLYRRYAHDQTVEVFHDLLIDWDVPGLEGHSPDIAVIFGVRAKSLDRTRFSVAEEGVRPSLVIEVVSPHYRKEDRVEKLIEYELARVPEYIILDQRRRRGQKIDEVLGYELRNGRYSSMLPDDRGRILSRAVGLWISLQDGKVILEEATTGERLLRSQELQDLALELEDRAQTAEDRAQTAEDRAQAAEALIQAEQHARQAAEARVRELEAQLRAMQTSPEQSDP